MCEREGERKKERDMGWVRERMHQCANSVTRSTNSARALEHFSLCAACVCKGECVCASVFVCVGV